MIRPPHTSTLFPYTTLFRSVHTRIDFDFVTAEGIAKYRRFMEEASDLVLSYGGSLSGEHGDGQSRAELLPKMFGDRKSTRLNSSHPSISYAVFCLKKKN